MLIKDIKSNRRRIAQWGNSVEKSGWNKDSSVGKFSEEKRLNKIPKQGINVTYEGRRRPPILPKERRHQGLPGGILEAQAKLVGLTSFPTSGKIQPEGERKNDMERPRFGEQGPHFIFQSSFYTLSYA